MRVEELYSGDHWVRLRDEVTQLLEEVPLYADRQKPPPCGKTPAEIAAWLAQIPTITKRELRRGFPKSLVRKSVDLRVSLEKGEVELISTSGTTGDRLQVLWQQPWWDNQEREGMRLNGLVSKALSNSYREAVLTTPICGVATCHTGNLTREERTIGDTLFLNQVADPTHWNTTELDRMVEEWQSFQPGGVEANPSYLAALARHLEKQGKRLQARFVTLTYELATRAHRRAIARTIGAPIFDLYGATEAGVLFMQCEKGRLHHNVKHSHIELLPIADNLARVVVTTLGRSWMPLLRYDVGDIVRIGGPAAACACGTVGLTVDRVEGRVGDIIQNGESTITAAMLDDVADSPALSAWQLQLSPSGALFAFMGDRQAGEQGAHAVGQLIGQTVQPRAAAIAPEGSGKYRLIQKSGF